jgi:hypothetical protein
MNVAKSKVVRLQDRCKQKRKTLTTNKPQTK